MNALEQAYEQGYTAGKQYAKRESSFAERPTALEQAMKEREELANRLAMLDEAIAVIKNYEETN